jgi:hypothetical protein
MKIGLAVLMVAVLAACRGAGEARDSDRHNDDGDRRTSESGGDRSGDASGSGDSGGSSDSSGSGGSGGTGSSNRDERETPLSGLAASGNSYQRAEAKFISSLFDAAAVTSFQSDFSVRYRPSPRNVLDFVIPDVSLTGRVAANQTALFSEIALDIDGEKLSNIQLAFDTDVFMVLLPEISQYFLNIAIPADIMGLAQQADLSIIDQLKVLSTVSAIGQIYFDLAERNSEVSKDVTISGGGVSLRADRYEINFTEDFISELGIKALNEIKKNKSLIDYIDSIMQSMYGYYYMNINDLFDEAEAELRNMSGTRTVLRMTVWVSGGEIVARSFEDRVNNSFYALYKTLNDGSNAHIDAEFRVNDMMQARLLGDFVKSRDGWSGVPKLTVSEIWGSSVSELFSISVSIENFDIDGDIVKGVIKSAGNIEDMEYDVTVSLDKVSNQQSIKVTGRVVYQQYDWWSGSYNTVDFDFGELTVQYSYRENVRVALPRINPNFAVNVDDYSPDNVLKAEKMLDDVYEYMNGLSGFMYEIINSILANTLYYMTW